MEYREEAKVRALRVRTLNAPLEKPHRTASGTVQSAPLVLVDLQTDAGVTGCAYVFLYTPLALRPAASLIANLEALVRGAPVAPGEVRAMLQGRFRLLGNQGLVGIAVAAIDMALWDALAKLRGVALARLLGAEPAALPVYDSLGQMGPEETAREVEASLKRGFRAFKVKAGHPDPATDLAVARAIRGVAGEGTWLAMDFNQAFSAAEAIRRARLLEGEGLAWIEEPVLAEDFAGHAEVRRAIAIPVQTGENWWGVADMAKAIAAGASDHVMPDAMKIGGVSGWLEAAALAARHGLALSSHLFAELSAHLLAATPTAHRLEWLDVAGAVNETPPVIADGALRACEAPGCGLRWNERAIAKLGA